MMILLTAAQQLPKINMKLRFRRLETRGRPGSYKRKAAQITVINAK
jgi:hypothetical protein